MSLAILCPGQGGQHPQMFAKVAAVPAARALLRELTAITGAPPTVLAMRADRYNNRIAQPLICAATLAHWQALRRRLPTPLLVLGYSVGELSAHAIAGSFDGTSCLRLACERAELMDAAAPAHSGLIAVQGLHRTALDALCVMYALDLAIVNGDDYAVLGGDDAALAQATMLALAQGARVTRLPVTLPAHTHWLLPAAEAFAQCVAAIAPRAPSIALLAGIDARPVTTAAQVATTLAAQIAGTVQWQSILRQASERGARVLLELGPGSALTRIVQEQLPHCQARSLEQFHSLDGAVAWVEHALAG